MATSRISSLDLVMTQPLKSFKPCCLRWSYCWILTPKVFKILRLTWTISYVYKDLIWRAKLCLCRFQFARYCCRSFSFPGCSSNRIVSPTTPGSVSLVHGFTHDKSVPYLFSTPQATSQQQTEILIHLLKKLAPVNDINGVLYLVDPMWIFSPRVWKELQC